MRILRGFLAFFAAVSLFGCGSDGEKVREEGKLQVYTSFYCVYDFVSQIGGDKVQVYNMLPNGAEPHNWEPTPGDMLKLENADFLFYNGRGRESWVDKVIGSVENKNIKYVELSKGIEFLDSNENTDPHIWLDPKNAKKEAETIKNALVMADSANEAYYNENYKVFADRIDKLDIDFKNAVSETKNKTIVVAHEAYGYLCGAYGLEQLGIEGLSAESEPSPAKMAEISKFVKNNGIKFIFFEELLTPKAASVISEETGAELLVLNPFEGITEQEEKDNEDYFSVMYKNLDNIKKALR